MKIVEHLISWLYALKIEEYREGLERLALDNSDWDIEKSWSFRFRNKSYDPFNTGSIYKPLLHPSLHTRAIEVIIPYESLVQGEQHYVRSVLMALTQASISCMHHHLPQQFHPQLAGIILLSPEPLPKKVWEDIQRVHAKGLALINERLLLNDLGV